MTGKAKLIREASSDKAMDARDRRFVAYEAYEKLADAYAEMVDTKPHNAYLARPATPSLMPDVRGRHVLDAGCGPGAYSEWLIRNGARITAVDASPRMVEHARRRLGTSADVRLHDIRAPLTFLGDGSVDVVLAALVMNYIEDWTPVFREFRRVLKVDGALVYSVDHPILDFTLKPNMENYFEVEKVEMTWTGFREPIILPSYRHPLGAMTEALHESGFLVERLIEARLTEDYRRADPEGYMKVSRRPTFICF